MIAGNEQREQIIDIEPLAYSCQERELKVLAVLSKLYA